MRGDRQKQIEAMKAAGFATASDAAAIIGRAGGSNIPALLDKHGVTSVTVECPGTKPIRMYLVADLSRVPRLTDETQRHTACGSGDKVPQLIQYLCDRMDTIQLMQAQVIELLKGADKLRASPAKDLFATNDSIGSN